MSLAHFWKIVMISSQPSEQYGFTTLFLFLLFLNSDIGIVILYIVKYIRKAFSLPKKINFEVQNLTNIHVFRFAFSDLYCYHTDLQNARNAVSDNLIFKISRGGMPPDPPSKERLRRSLVRIINWSHPPVKNPGYGPDAKIIWESNAVNIEWNEIVWPFTHRFHKVPKRLGIVVSSKLFGQVIDVVSLRCITRFLNGVI